MLRNIDEARSEGFSSFALAICYPSLDQFHSAMLYENLAGELRLLHLADNFDLRNHEPDSRYKWVPAALPRPKCKLLAVLCDRVGSLGQQLPYGFDKNGISIDRTSGRVSPIPEEKGLTCASFILIMLETYGIRLLKEEEWPAGVNNEWQAQSIERLRLSGKSSAEQLRTMEESIGACRFTPTEVVGASTVRPWPVGYTQATTLGILLSVEIYAAKI